MGGGGNDGGGVLGAGGGSRNVGHPSEFRLAARRLHSLYRLRSIRFKAPCTARLPACLPRLLTCGVLCATSLAVRVSERRVAAIQECDLSIPDFLPPIFPPSPPANWLQDTTRGQRLAQPQINAISMWMEELNTATLFRNYNL